MQKEVILRYCDECERPLGIIIDEGGNSVQAGIIHGDSYYCDKDCWSMDNDHDDWDEFYKEIVREQGEDQDVTYYTEWEIEELE